MELLGIIDVPMWVLLLTGTTTLLYILGTKNHGFYKGTGIPGPRPLPFLGNFILLLRKGLADFDTEMRKEYGNVIGTFSASTPELIIFDVEMINQVLIKQFSVFPHRRVAYNDDKTLANMLSQISDAHHWKHLRSTMAPSFTTGKLRKMAGEINRCGTELTKKTSTGEPFEARALAGNFTMGVIASTAFGLKVNTQENENDPFLVNARKLTDLSFKDPRIVIALMAPSLAVKLGISFLNKDATKFFGNVTEQALETRQADDKSRSDFLQLMARAKRGESIVEKEDAQELEKEGASAAKRGLTKGEITSNGLIFFLAGFDTASIGLTMLLYSLACNQEAQDKLLDEIDSALADEAEVDYDSVMKMEYLDMCFQESSRMYTQGFRLERQAKEDIVLSGIKIKKDAVVIIPVHAIHQDPENYPEPEKFKPERFSAEERAKRHPMLSMPFGAGPRNCIAMRLAIYEIKAGVVHVLRNHKVVTCAKTEQPVQWQSDKWLTSKNGIWLACEKRK